MVAGLTLRVYTSTGATTESSAVTGIDFISADNATNSLANRQANPITVATASYEKWLKLKVDTAPANSVSNFKIWGDGAVATSTTLYFTGAYTTGVTPTNATSTIANTTFNNWTSGNKATWDSGSYTATNATTKYVVFQLAVGSDCNPGYWGGVATGAETISYSYDET
jgi:hypothetical protein